ncbi:MAG TPA: hypothetical protein VK591_16310 [Xanthobacteraceae bacterium]|nr:hypothetical protein [Xanthobacteraceae bacterium]
MTAPQLENITQTATAALDGWNSFVSELSSLEGPDHVAFDLEKPIPGVSPATSIEQIGTKLTGALALAHNLSTIESTDLIPDAAVTEVTARVSAVRTSVEKLLAQITGFEKDSDIVSLDPTIMTAANQKSQQINLPPTFSELYQAVQGLLVSLYQIRTMSKLSEKGGYTLHLSQLNAARSAQQKAYGNLNRLRHALEGNRDRLVAIISEAQSASQELATAKTQVAETLTRTEESKSRAESLVSNTNGINDSANKLKESVDAYQNAFAKFQADLDGRTATFAQGKADLDRLLAESKSAYDKLVADGNAERTSFLSDGKASLEKLVAEGNAERTKFASDSSTALEKFLADGRAGQDKLLSEKTKAHDQLLAKSLEDHQKIVSDLAVAQKEVDRLLARSREVLGEATVSGLSESFAREMKSTGNQLGWIRILFYFSVAGLAAAAGIVLNAFPWLEAYIHIAKFEPPANADPMAIGLLYLGNFLSKLTFLLPFFILMLFAGRRYTEVFRLKTQYTYKYAVAASLPGFKVEAPNFADAVTALAFKELLFNPGERVNAPEDMSKDASGGSTFIQRLIEPIVKKAMDKIGDATKSPV